MSGNIDKTPPPALDRITRRMARDRELPQCRHCHGPLATVAEIKLGIHIRCVFEIDQRAIRVRVSRPSYKFRTKRYGDPTGSIDG